MLIVILARGLRAPVRGLEATLVRCSALRCGRIRVLRGLSLGIISGGRLITLRGWALRIPWLTLRGRHGRPSSVLHHGAARGSIGDWDRGGVALGELHALMLLPSVPLRVGFGAALLDGGDVILLVGQDLLQVHLRVLQLLHCHLGLHLLGERRRQGRRSKRGHEANFAGVAHRREGERHSGELRGVAPPDLYRNVRAHLARESTRDVSSDLDDVVDVNDG